MASGAPKTPRPGTGSAAAPARRDLSGVAEGGGPGMHRKMCKKIAQLTKVIYALNTKNDEHEESIQALKDTHQEEIQRILAETRETALQYESKVEEAQMLQRHIQVLEAALEKHRKHKEEALSEIATCKEEYLEDDPQARQGSKMFLFKKVGRSEPDVGKNVWACSEDSVGFANQPWAFVRDTWENQGKLSGIPSMDLQEVVGEMVKLKWENQPSTEDYTRKASQLQTSQERERALQQPLADSYKEGQQRKNNGTQEVASDQQVGELEAHLEARGQEISELKKYSQKLKEKMQDLKMQLKEAQQVTAESQSISKTLEEELVIAKEKLLLQEKELMHKREAMQGAPNSRSKSRSQVDGLKDRNVHPQRALPIRHSQGSQAGGASQDPFVQQSEISKQSKEKAKIRDQPTSVLSTRNGEKQRLDPRGTPKKEDKRSSASLPKETTKTLQEEWYYQKTELEAQVTRLKQILEQQEKTFREAFKQQDLLHSSKEKEKVLQDAIKQSQDHEVQLEASQQKAINLLEKEFKEVKETWKNEYDDKFKAHRQSHIREMQALEDKARKVLQSELQRMQKQQSLLIDSLRKELSEQQVSSMVRSKVEEELQEELKNLMGVQKQQEESYQAQVQSLKDELEKCQKEISRLKKENSLLKDAVDLLSGDVELQKQSASELQGRENQEKRLDEIEEKSRKRAPRLEDLHLISCLQDKLNEKEEMIKELMDGRTFQHPLLPRREVQSNRSFSFSTSPVTCLTPIAKQKKKMDEAAPSCIVTVPNLASYAKSFLSGELRPKRTQPQNIKSTSLDQNLGCVRVCCPSIPALENKPPSSLQSNETSKPKDAQKPDLRHQEWFTKYFSF
ncbi:protein FAM184B [Candoia aspera]|uniref:protein FAM184B n=1 Tax=Candoia aspera TaxID=51853 RepID=UPI002FD7A2A4